MVERFCSYSVGFDGDVLDRRLIFPFNDISPFHNT